jgi:hypothetical protein
LNNIWTGLPGQSGWSCARHNVPHRSKHSSNVNPEHRNFLHFLWFEDNDLSKDIVECQMTVHLFGNGPSPAIATFVMRKTADHGEEKFGTETKEFVHKDFYVDDGLTSRATEPELTDLVTNAQAMLLTCQSSTPQCGLKFYSSYGIVACRRPRKGCLRSRSPPRRTSRTTFSWRILGPGKRRLHVSCISTQETIHT